MIADFTENLNWRGGREAEGAPLLREYGPKAHRGFESRPLRHLKLNSGAVKKEVDSKQ
jgi:hypothetical protein